MKNELRITANILLSFSKYAWIISKIDPNPFLEGCVEAKGLFLTAGVAVDGDVNCHQGDTRLFFLAKMGGYPYRLIG